MSGFISFLFALLFTVALTLAIVFRQEQKPKLARIFWVISTVVGVVTVIAGWVYYLTPVPTPLPAVIQAVPPVPPGKPYVVCQDSHLDELSPGKTLVLSFIIQNGPVATTVVFKDVSFTLTRMIPERYLTYTPSEPADKFNLAPNQKVTARWTYKNLNLTQEDIDELNADDPTAELYFFARGEYTDDAGVRHSLPYCRKYDKGPAGHVVFCADSISVK